MHQFCVATSHALRVVGGYLQPRGPQTFPDHGPQTALASCQTNRQCYKICDVNKYVKKKKNQLLECFFSLLLKFVQNKNTNTESTNMLTIMAVFLYGGKATLNVSCLICSYFSWPILFAAVSSTAGLFVFTFGLFDSNPSILQ